MNFRVVRVALALLSGVVAARAVAAGDPRAAAEVVLQALRPAGSDGNNAMSFTADGRLLAVGGAEVRLFEPRSGLLVRGFPLPPTDPKQGPVVCRHVALSPDGRLLAAAVGSPRGELPQLNQIRVWETATGKLVKRLSFDVAALRFLADGRLSVLVPKFAKDSGKRIDEMVLVDVRTGKKVAAKGLLANERVVAEEPAGRVWAESRGGQLALVDLGSGARLRTVKPGTDGYVAFSPDFALVVTGQSEKPGLELRDTATGALVRTLALPFGLIRALSFAEGGKSVVAAALPEVKLGPDGPRDNPDELLFFFSAGTGELLRKLSLPKSAHSDGSMLSAGGRVLVVNTNTTEQMRFFDTDTGLQIAGEAGSLHMISQLSWSEDGGRLLASDAAPAVSGPGTLGTQVWDLAAGRMARRIDAGRALFLPGGSALLFNTRTAVADGRSFAPGRELPKYASDAAFPSDGKLLAVPELNREVHVIELASLRVLATFPGNDTAFSPDGAVLAVQEVGKRVIHLYDGHTFALLRTCTDEDARGEPLGTIAFAPDGAHFAAAGSNNFHHGVGTLDLYETATCKKRPLATSSTSSIFSLSFSADGRRLAASGSLVQVFDVASGKVVAALELSQPASGVAFRPGRAGELAVATEGGEIALWRTADPQPYARLYGLGPSDYVVLLPDSRYGASRGALRSVAFRVGTRALPFEQFDLRFNRPDAILAALGSASPARIEAARASVQKRLKRAGFTEEQLTGELVVPEVSLASTPPPTTKERELSVTVRATSASAALDRLLVTVNDVPIAGSGGIDVKARAARELTEAVAIRLSGGKNRVQISALDARGVESLRTTFEIVLDAPPNKPDLYVVAVGVSAYRDADRSLRYAAKDAADLAAFFAKQRGSFGRIKVLSLLDGDAVKEKIAAAKALLAEATVDDEAVVFFAGHGLRDEKLDYYFATADVDFEHPAARGLPYEALEGLLEGVAARRKLLLIDTCNSGELDKDEATLATADTKVAEGVIKSRGVKVVKTRAPALGLEGSTGLLEDVFADLRRGSGAVAIASAGGAEFALESDAWKNGVFTYALLSTMSAGKSRVSEVRDLVTAKVTELTAGKQRPTVRRENLSNDFAIY